MEDDETEKRYDTVYRSVKIQEAAEGKEDGKMARKTNKKRLTPSEFTINGPNSSNATLFSSWTFNVRPFVSSLGGGGRASGSVVVVVVAGVGGGAIGGCWWDMMDVREGNRVG